LDHPQRRRAQDSDILRKRQRQNILLVDLVDRIEQIATLDQFEELQELSSEDPYVRSAV